MSILSKLLWWRREESEAQPAGGKVKLASEKIVELPDEPYVFECRSCGKVFEARRRRPLCPECDSNDVVVMSE